MIWSHYILLYFWYCLEANHGQMLIPLSFVDLKNHLGAFGSLVLTKGIPSKTMWMGYFSFFFIQILLASFMPGNTFIDAAFNHSKIIKINHERSKNGRFTDCSPWKATYI